MSLKQFVRPLIWTLAVTLIYASSAILIFSAQEYNNATSKVDLISTGSIKK